MKNTHGHLPLLLIATGCAMTLGAGVAAAETVQARLSGFNETPSVSTGASAHFKARIDEHAGSVFWELDYDGLQADATQAHIHFGQRHTAGGITVWLCSNLPPPVPPATGTPLGTQACPLRSGTINGTFTATNVVGPGGAQQLPAGGFDQLLQAIRAGATYANVHTTASPAGEIRGQIHDNDHDNDHDHGHHR
jgi:hypothetical protein